MSFLEAYTEKSQDQKNNKFTVSRKNLAKKQVAHVYAKDVEITELD